MRISDIDLQCEDIMWFGIDTNGNIFECTSAGCGNVPEYVCRSREETNTLLEYFSDTAPRITDAKLLIPASDNDLTTDAIKLASKGIFCFDITDYDHDEVYHCIAIPKRPLHVSELPEEIRKLLSDHLYEGNVAFETSIAVKHAY
ncbi:MAG: hypothetical protein HUJ58_00475 [Erysipelotrichaceae bacterium]|nr:hypothetical protein [Erysipelotrichaceae bacterium]